jgi:hypothetical protein
MQNKIQRRILKKASALGRVFGRWGGFYMLYRCLFGVFLSHNTAFESMVAGGLTSMTVAKIGKRVNSKSLFNLSQN